MDDACFAAKCGSQIVRFFDEKMGLFLVDTCAAIGGAINTDGIHVTDKGSDRWYAALKEHAQIYALVP